MKSMKVIFILTVVTGALVLGCSDDQGGSDSDAQSSDDTVFLDSASETAVGTDSQILDSAVPDGTDSVVDTVSDVPDTTDTATNVEIDSDVTTDSVVDTAIVDTSDTGADTSDSDADTSDTGVDTIDTGADTGDTGVDTSDTGADTEDTGADSDTALDTDTTVCPFVCRSENWCNNNDGIMYDELECEEETQVCCEVETDSDTETDADTGEDTDVVDTEDDTATESDDACPYECHASSWCNLNDAEIFEDYICTGNQICCELVQP